MLTKKKNQPSGWGKSPNDAALSVAAAERKRVSNTVQDAPPQEMQQAPHPGLSPRMQRIVAGWATIHLAAIAFSYFASNSPSSFESRLLDLCRPYLSLLHQDTEGMTLAISRNLPAEKTHEMQVLADKTTDDAAWDGELGCQTVDNTRGPAGGCRQRRWQRLLAHLAELGELDQAALATWFVTPLVDQMPVARQIRIVRLPDLMTTVVDDNAAAPYAVAVVRSEESPTVQLLQLPAKRLVAPAQQRQTPNSSEKTAP